jgi:hypothetical protein
VAGLHLAGFSDFTVENWRGALLEMVAAVCRRLFEIELTAALGKHGLGGVNLGEGKHLRVRNTPSTSSNQYRGTRSERGEIMPRDIPVGNGSLLVNFDRSYQLRDLYWPHVGQENHTAGHPFRFGVWVDGQFRSIAY